MTNEEEYLKTAMYAKLYGGGDDELDKLIASEDYLNDDGFSDFEYDELDDEDLVFDDDFDDDFDDYIEYDWEDDE